MKLIKIKPYHFIVVDDSRIMMGDWYVDDTYTVRKSMTSEEDYWAVRRDYRKVTHSTMSYLYKGIKELNLEEINRLILFDALNEKAEEYATVMCCDDGTTAEDFKAGYLQCLKDNNVSPIESIQEWGVEFVNGKLKLEKLN